MNDKEKDWHLANLTEEQTQNIEQLENELGVVLIAYEEDRHTKS